MYTKEIEITLTQLAKKLLSHLQQEKLLQSIDETLDALRRVISYNDWRYYVESEPVISDYEYDQLFAWLKKLELEHPDLVTSDSPTQRVAQGLTKEFITVPHLVPMLSLENSYNADDLLDWDRKARESAGLNEIEYCIEPKFDGASISLIYEDDRLTRGATRGDGVAGEDITTNIKQIRSIPLSASFSKYGIHQIEIRGEVLINKNTFKAFNDKRIADNQPPLANPRNAASGSLRMVDPNEVAKRGLEAFLYHMSYHNMNPGKAEPDAIKTHSGTLELLSTLGFRSPAKEKKVIKGIQGVIDYVLKFETERDNLPYEIDGMVIKVNDYNLQDRLGMTTHHPRWAIAYKFKARQATSKLRSVEFQVGRTGSITPVAKIDPVPIGGVTVGSISLFNEEVIKEKDLKLGDTVLVERAGDVIPYIVKSVADLRDGSEQDIIFPTHCPVCHDKLVKPEGESVWRCTNISCEAQVVERMIHFVSKDAMDIKSFGESNVRKFFSLGLLKDIPGIYELDFEKIGALEGFGKKSLTNLQSAIEQSKTQPLHRLIFGLGIRYVGETTAKTLANAVNHIMDLQNWTEEQILALEDIGPKVAGSIRLFFANNDNIEMLNRLAALGISMTNTKKETHTSGNLNGQTFLFTGTLHKLKRTEAEEMVEQEGGKIVSGVSSKLNYLVVGDDAGSKLEKAKKINTIKILSEDEFLAMINK
ncbi:NAD-dependent DNA ligase LigA [Chitinophaga ginsengisegetis]|uniref:NAD-dependent DNA ligase LigA n=1 Tax=Chitinophaga ginsengisegetis TaxID=393003 RepID=UPI000DB8FCD1|nr:NAD-dependent DNA ligase LigA [Chitinophaga ginsengisegetis]MDR6566531.1 DNA ligase (NAD+) [Chitinophaga ginsengisegetis]MDR6646261.1 DNA ligase (NAD+) [Chitinophaga ginsengisegetis]MDR6651146.1 DNA ligase (NAD+) [Chitinophaga ginsengisegetis]